MNSSNYLNKITAWDVDAARHILSRTLYGFTKADIDFALSKTLDDFVDNYLLKDQPVLSTPNYLGSEWVTLPHNTANSANYTNWKNSLVWWWQDLMLTQGYSFREKMVWFWANHFVTEYTTVSYPQLIYLQNKLFREYAFGNIIELTKKITIDPAMLIYLNGNQSTKTAPNENYARELMELFTLGIGNYTEDDIKQAAKALTGWQINYTTLTSSLTSSRYDSGSKTIFGKTGTYDANGVVDLIFTEKTIPASEHFCRRLYKEFVYYNPNEDYVKQLAAVMRTSSYNLKPVLSVLLKSQYFHSTEIRGAKIKSSVEFLMNMVRQFGIATDTNFLNYIRTTSASLEQDILNPPDVRGWEGQRKWINTLSYPSRNKYSDAIVNGTIKISNKIYKVDSLAFAKTFPSSENAVQFIEDVTKVLIAFPLSQARKDFLLTTMLDGTIVQNWSTNSQGVSTRLDKMLKALMRLPEYQLS